MIDSRLTQSPAEQPSRLLYPIPEVADLLCISERLAWELVLSGELTSVRIGRRRLVSRSALETYVHALEE